MRIREDELNGIATDRFVSASGLWTSYLCERFEPTPGGALRVYYVAIATSDTKRVRMIKRIAVDDRELAIGRWEAWKQVFSQADPTRTYESEIPSGLSELKFSPPHLIPEDEKMLQATPNGARIVVREITPVDEVTARAAQAGLIAVVDEANKPKPTQGIVVAVGEDPFVQERYRIGDILTFSKHAGNYYMEDGLAYRVLEDHEIIMKRKGEAWKVEKDAHLGAIEA